VQAHQTEVEWLDGPCAATRAVCTLESAFATPGDAPSAAAGAGDSRGGASTCMVVVLVAARVPTQLLVLPLRLRLLRPPGEVLAAATLLLHLAQPSRQGREICGAAAEYSMCVKVRRAAASAAAATGAAALAPTPARREGAREAVLTVRLTVSVTQCISRQEAWRGPRACMQTGQVATPPGCTNAMMRNGFRRLC
jgi:hypothetical protein